MLHAPPATHTLSESVCAHRTGAVTIVEPAKDITSVVTLAEPLYWCTLILSYSHISQWKVDVRLPNVLVQPLHTLKARMCHFLTHCIEPQTLKLDNHFL